MKVFTGRPTFTDMVGLLIAVEVFGQPRFIITDHGSQFRRRFRRAVRAPEFSPVRSRVRSAAFNGKVERLFKTLRLWQRRTLLPLTLDGIQHRLDGFKNW